MEEEDLTETIITICENRHSSQLMQLLDNGLDVNWRASDEWYNAPLLICVIHWWRSYLDGWSSLVSLILNLLKRGADPTLTSSIGETVFHVIILSSQKYELLYIFVRLNIDINVKWLGKTAVEFGCDMNQIDHVKILIEAGADIPSQLRWCSQTNAEYMYEKIPRRIENCRKAILTFLLVRKHGLGPIKDVDKHVVLKICKLMWKMRRCWYIKTIYDV